VVEHLSVRDSIKGTLGGGLYLGTRKMRFLRDMQMSCRRASLFTGALLGNLEGFVCRDFWEKSISGFLFLDPEAIKI